MSGFKPKVTPKPTGDGNRKTLRVKPDDKAKALPLTKADLERGLEIGALYDAESQTLIYFREPERKG